MTTPPVALPIPHLPPGWSEHVGPGGQPYFYNTHTQESTYVRPIPAFPVVPMIPAEPVKPKEKPFSKTPIPGTDWLRVKTTAGNIFYSHKVKKESIWTIPEEIKDAVQKMDAEEQPQPHLTTEIGREEAMEVERVKVEVQSMIKRKAEENTPPDQVVSIKKAKVEDTENEEDEEDSESEEEEQWQRDAAEQLAAEAEAEKIRLEQETERLKRKAEEEAKKAQALVPNRVDLSIEEGKALFKNLLREKDINPLHPWDLSLPKFISDPRYVLLPYVAARREAFDEYCRVRARELREAAVKHEREVLDPKDAFERLLSVEVISTRTSWTDFRRKWKKDRRFYSWGKDDREREKKFREYIKELGDKKRTMAEKAEADFLALLQEKGGIEEGSLWKDIKRKLYSDSRYDAVGSASLREELFNSYVKGSRAAALAVMEKSSEEKGEPEFEGLDEAEMDRKLKEKRELAVREREQKVRVERDRLEADIGKSRMDVDKGEGERDFMNLLTDAIRDPQITWDAALPQLRADSRLRNSPLSPNHQLHLFQSHIGRLRAKQVNSLHSLFEKHSLSLADQFSALPVTPLVDSTPAIKLGYSVHNIRREFERWQRERTHTARLAFDQMLTENSFVDFWGRLTKIGGEGVDGGVKAEETEGDEGEGGGGKVDMKVLAKNIDLEDMEKVLKSDKRYTTFDHVPDQRERWIRDYISNLSAPKLSVHIPQHSGTV